MSIQKRLIYMMLGGILALSLFVGGFAVFAQSGDDGDTDEGTTTEPEAGEAESSTDESSTESAVPGDFHFRFRGFEGSDDSELLADALGITVDELADARQAAFEAAIQQAVDEGLITEAQAEELLSRDFGLGRGFGRGIHVAGIDFNALLADALGISVEELQEARMEVQAAKLAELVEAGAITQEQADLMLARQAVQEYVDREAISEALQDAYESAVNDALEAGAITQEQADLMLENMPAFDGQGIGIGGPGFHGPGGRGFHGSGGRGFQGQGGQGGFFAPSFGTSNNAATSGA